MYTWTKNNPEQRDTPKGLACVDGCEGDVKKGADGKWVAPKTLCPVHIGWHSKTLQARDACVPVAELKAPVFSKVARFDKVPPGATLVVDKTERDEVAQKVGKLVLVITREQEQQGLMYDGSIPFMLNGRKFRPPVRGVWFAVAGKGYAVFAWASAAGVTHRIRKLMYKANSRSEVEEVPEEVIKKLSSRSLRIAMATLMTHRGVPMDELVPHGEWEDAAMAGTYIRSHAPLAVQRRNMTNVIFPARTSGTAQTGAVQGAVAGSGALLVAPHTPRVEAELVAAVLEQEGGAAAAPGQPMVQWTASIVATPAAVNEVALAAATVARALHEPLEQGAAGRADGGAVVQQQQGGVATQLLPVAEAPVAEAPPQLMAAPPPAPRKKNKERSEYQPCCPALWVKGKVFKRTNVLGDARLRGLLEDTAGEPPAKVMKVLCEAQYHVTRKEITNFRERKVQQAMVAPEVDPAEVLQEIAGMNSAGPLHE